MEKSLKKYALVTLFALILGLGIFYISPTPSASPNGSQTISAPTAGISKFSTPILGIKRITLEDNNSLKTGTSW